LDKSFYGDRQTDDTEANTIARTLYLFFITIVMKKKDGLESGIHTFWQLAQSSPSVSKTTMSF
jgi:hypothetical protein